MQLALGMLTKIPEGWPRILILVVIALILFFPELRKAVIGEKVAKKKLEDARNLLQLRQLQIQVDKLKDKDTTGADVGADLDAEIEKILAKPTSDEEEFSLPAWRTRAIYGFGGAAFFLILGVLIAAFRPLDPVTGLDLLMRILKGLILAVISGSVASVFPRPNPWANAVLGFGLPFFVAIIILLSR